MKKNIIKILEEEDVGSSIEFRHDIKKLDQTFPKLTSEYKLIMYHDEKISHNKLIGALVSICRKSTKSAHVSAKELCLTNRCVVSVGKYDELFKIQTSLKRLGFNVSIKPI